MTGYWRRDGRVRARGEGAMMRAWRNPAEPAAARGRSSGRRVPTALVCATIAALLVALLPGTATAAPTGSISGRIYGPDGTPAAGIRVTALGVTAQGDFMVTGTDGSYRIDGLPADHYYLVVDQRDHSGRLPGGYVQGGTLTPYGPLASPFRVAERDLLVDVRVPAGHRIRGKVTLGGQPLADGVVSACVAFDGALPDWTRGGYCDQTGTNADGTYAIAILPGPYTVSFVAGSGWMSPDGLPLTYYYAASGATPDGASATIVTVGGRDVSGISVALPAHAPSYPGGISGRVTDAGGAGVPGIGVSACSTAAPARCFETTTNSESGTDGTYSLRLPAGTFTVAFDDPGLANPSGFYGAQGFVATLADAAAITVDGGVVGGIDARLPVGHRVGGTVTGPDGGPLAGIEVAPCASPACGALASITGRDGRYTLKLAPGNYGIHAMDPSGLYLSGYYAQSGLADAANLTPIVVGATDVAGVDIVLRSIGAGVAPGVTRSGPFESTHTLLVKPGRTATVRLALGTGFAGSTVAIQVATRPTTGGAWSAYRTVTTRRIGADGNAYYPVHPSGWMSIRGAFEDPVVSAVTAAAGLGTVAALSNPVVVEVTPLPLPPAPTDFVAKATSKVLLPCVDQGYATQCWPVDMTWRFGGSATSFRIYVAWTGEIVASPACSPGGNLGNLVLTMPGSARSARWLEPAFTTGSGVPCVTIRAVNTAGVSPPVLAVGP